MTTLDDLDEEFAATLRAELEADEQVRLVLEFVAELERNVTSHPGARNQRAAVLAVTDSRVLQLSRKGIGAVMIEALQSETSGNVDVGWVPLAEVQGVTGRRTALSLGLGSDLHLELKDGRRFTVRGLAVAQAEQAEEIIRTALAPGDEQADELDRRAQFERMFRERNPAFAGGSEGSIFEQPLDFLADHVWEDDELVELIAWKDLGLRGQPARILCQTDENLYIYVSGQPDSVVYNDDDIDALNTGGNRFSGHWITIAEDADEVKLVFPDRDVRDRVFETIAEFAELETA